MKNNKLGRLLITFVFVFLGSLACLAAPTTQPINEGEPLTEISAATLLPTPEPLTLGSAQSEEGICPGGSGDASCWLITVSCPQLDDSHAFLRISGEGTAGTILLTTGGNGAGLYRLGGEFREGIEGIGIMMDSLLDDGYKLVEIAWRPPRIWDITEDDVGSITLACRAATVFQWVFENHHLGGLFGAQGNSGGASQIAFSLAYYGMGEILDVANLGGGPPPCPIVYAAGTGKNNDEQPLCIGGPGVWDESKEPILSGNPQLDYPNTIVNFFVGEDEPNLVVKESAEDYYEAITSEKSHQLVPNTRHGVHLSKEGRAALMQAIEDAANQQ